MEPQDLLLSHQALHPQGGVGMGSMAGICAWPMSAVTSLSLAKGEKVFLDDLGGTWKLPTLFPFSHAQLLHDSHTCLAMA